MSLFKRKYTLDVHSLEVLKGSFVAFSVKALGAILVLLFSILIAHQYGASVTGIYFLVISIMMFVSIVSSWGVDRSLLKNISIFNAHNNLIDISKGVWTGLLIVFIFATFGALFLYFFSTYLALTVFNNELLKFYFQIIAFAVVPFVVIRTMSEIMKALKRNFYAHIYLGVLIPFFMSIVLLVTASLSYKDIEMILYMYVCTLFLIMTMTLIHMYKLIKPVENFFSSDIKNIILISATPLLLISISNNIQNFGGTYLLGIFSTTEEIGIFNISYRVAFILNFILIAINSIVAPKFSHLYAIKDFSALKISLRFSMILGLIFGLPLYIVIMIFPGEILQLFGTEFLAGVDSLRIMASAQMIVIISGPLGFFLIMTGEEKTMRNIAVISVFIFVLLGIIFIPVYEGLGAAASFSISIVLTSVASIYYARKKYNQYTNLLC